MGCGASNAFLQNQTNHAPLLNATTLRPSASGGAIYCPPPPDFDLLEDKDEDNEEGESIDNWPVARRPKLEFDSSHAHTPIDMSNLGVEHLSFDEACEKLDIVINLLRSQHHLQQQSSAATGTTTTTTISSFCPWKFVKYYTYHRPNLPRNIAAKWLEKLVDNRLASVCINIWPAFEDKYVQDQSIKNLQAFIQPITTLWNGTGNSAKFCQQFLASDGIRIVSSTLRSLTFNIQATNARKDDNVFCVVSNGCLSILYNVLHAINQLAKSKFRSEGSHSIAMDYFQQCQINGIKSKALFCLAYGCNDEELGTILTMDTQLIGSLLIALTEALENPSREGGLAVLGFEFPLMQLVECCNRLGLNDENKRRLLEAGMVGPLKCILDEPKRDEEIVSALNGLWALSFDVQCFDVLRTDVDLLAKLKHMYSWKNRKISDIANGFLWWITYGGLQEPMDMASKSPEVQHAAISYHCQYKQWAILMKNELERIGYHVWIDLDWNENGAQSAFTYMAEGLLQSNLIVAFVSNSYQESCQCRTEFEYASLLKKPLIILRAEADYEPDGWLSNILKQIPASPPIDMSTVKALETNLRPLLDQIKADIQKQSVNRMPSDAEQKMYEKMRKSSAHSKLDVSCWPETDVQRWLDQCGFVRHKDKFDAIDGRKLLALKETYFTMPTDYFKELKRLLVKPNFETMLALTNALLSL